MSLIGLLNYLDQKRGQEQYGNLLKEYWVPGDPNVPHALDAGPATPRMVQQSDLQRHGGFRGEGGVLSGGPPQEFYVRAAALPGYQQLAQQAQVGQQAMERQAASQQWQEQNMTAGQKAQLDVTKEEQKWKREREEMAWNTKAGMTNYQAEQIALAKQAQARLAAGGGGGAAQPGGVVFGAPPSGYSMSIDPVTRQPVLQPMVGGKDWTENTQNMQKLNASVGALDDMIKFVKEKGAFETGAKSGQISAGQRQTVIAGLSALNNMGVLQQGELELLQEQVSDPNAWGSIRKNSNTVIGQLQGVRERFIKASKDAYSRSQGSASAPPPPAGFTRAQ